MRPSSDGSKTRRPVLKGCARGREGGPRPSCSWQHAEIFTNPAHFPRATSPLELVFVWQAQGCQQESPAVRGQTQLRLCPQPTPTGPRLSSLICHSPLHLPVLKTQSQIPKQHPTGVLYRSKQPGKIYEKGGGDLFPPYWNEKVIFIRSGAG